MILTLTVISKKTVLKILSLIFKNFSIQAEPKGEDDHLFPWDLRICREKVGYPENEEDMKSAGFKDLAAENKFDVVGGLCENNDKFAIDRPLFDCWNKDESGSYPKYTPAVGDYMLIHESGAHGHSMGFQYNGKLRSAEILLRTDGTFLEMRRPETREDLFACIPDAVPETFTKL